MNYFICMRIIRVLETSRIWETNKDEKIEELRREYLQRIVEMLRTKSVSEHQPRALRTSIWSVLDNPSQCSQALEFVKPGEFNDDDIFKMCAITPEWGTHITGYLISLALMKSEKGNRAFQLVAQYPVAILGLEWLAKLALETTDSKRRVDSIKQMGERQRGSAWQKEPWHQIIKYAEKVDHIDTWHELIDALARVNEPEGIRELERIQARFEPETSLYEHIASALVNAEESEEDSSKPS